MPQINDAFVSVTDLQKNTKACISNINIVGRKVILSNNKPQAVLLSLDEFSRLTHHSRKGLLEVHPTKEETQAIETYERSKANNLLSFVLADTTYFDNLRWRDV